MQFETAYEGPFNSVCYNVTLDDGSKVRLSGKQASLIALLVSGYRLRDDFHPFDAFEKGSLDSGRAFAKVVDQNVATQTTQG